MKKSIKTFLKHAAKDYFSRSVNPPIVRASTVLFKTVQELKKQQKDEEKNKDVSVGIMAEKGAKQQFNYKRCLKNWSKLIMYF